MREKVFLSFLCLLFLVTIFKISEITNTDPYLRNKHPTPTKTKVIIPASLELNRPIVILHWNKAYDKYLFLNEDLEQCPNSIWKKCHVITNRKKAEDSDVITFYGYALGTYKRLEKELKILRKNSNATFVYHVREPPTLTGALGNWSNNFFDISMTYRSDSDIFNGLYKIFPNKFIDQSKLDNNEKWIRPDFSQDLKILRLALIKPKTKVAAWLVSKCPTPGHRGKYVKRLEEYIDIDIFGRCGKKPLEKSKNDDKNLGIYKKLLRSYYFYLSFENTRCKDYISEKFYNVLATASAIPIVFGPSKSEYEAVAPPYSFIHVNDFKNPEDLADYMNYLIDNTTAYMEYFWWTSYYTVKRTELICSFCEKMYNLRSSAAGQNTQTKRIEDFNDYWVNKADCNNPQTAPWQIIKSSNTNNKTKL